MTAQLEEISSQLRSISDLLEGWRGIMDTAQRLTRHPWIRNLMLGNRR
jgi:hypothetical protein